MKQISKVAGALTVMAALATGALAQDKAAEQKGMSGMSGMQGQKGMSGMGGMSGMEGKK